MPEPTTVAWNLSDLFDSTDDPRIDATLDDALARACAFGEQYRGKINTPDLSATTLLKAITEYEALAQDMSKPAHYASLVFAADTSKHEHGALLQKIQERQTEIALELMFFELELLAVEPDIIDPIVKDTSLDRYRHFVHAARLFREHRLTEPEERIMEEKANSGGRAFERLFEESLSAMEFPITVDGEEKVLTEPEVIALLRDHNRETRKAAAASLSEGLRKNSRLLTFIFNTLLFDKSVDDRLRSYEYPEQYRNTSNELSRETVETLISAVVDSYPVSERYHRLKREVLGYDKLMHYDRYAPIFESKKEYSFDQAREMVLASFERFSPEIAAAASEFFTNGWIDAASRPGKRGGAFCDGATPDLHPYVFMTYLNRGDDVMTLAHELGHGVHAYLARPLGLLSFHATLPVCELASTFGEMLVFDALVAEADLEEKLSLYAQKIENVFATVLRQTAMYKFEQELHRARRELGELTPDEIGEMWQRNIQAMFGDSLELGEEHAMWWMYVNHFVGTPFYVYAYSFGELLVLALYAMYREQGPSFVTQFIELLKSGGSLSPEDLLSRVGIDIKSPAFWQGGAKLTANMVDKFEGLYREWKAR